jgi:FAD/FMN-containing dehydrogenase
LRLRLDFGTVARMQTPLAQLQSMLPELPVSREQLELFRTDIFYVAEHLPLAVVTPRDATEVQRLVTAARELKLSLCTRGAGLSYSAGYIPTDEESLIVDMTAMNRVVEVNTADRYVVVEPGVTWAALHDALRDHGVTTPFWGTFSGLHATIGASLAQGAKFYGSGHRGTSAESVLGLKVVTGTGELLVTGSAASTQQPSPFFRNYGPDLTGLFLGDSGAFGIKVEATLQLIPAAGAVEMCSYSFDDPAVLLRTMGKIGAEMLATECLAMDPFTARSRIASAGLWADLKTLGAVVSSSPSKLAGVRDALAIAAGGRRFANKIGYLMSCIAEGRDRADAGSRIRRIKRIAADAGGRPIPATIPKVMRATPFPRMNSLLTPSAKRMNWLHTVVPNSRAVECFNITENAFSQHREAMQRCGIDRGYLLSAHGPTGVGIETLIRWSDAPYPIHSFFFDDADRHRLRARPENLPARQAVVELSNDIVARWAAMGGVHMQIGRKYPYLKTRLPETRALLLQLKQVLDPDGLINPHNLMPRNDRR